MCVAALRQQARLSRAGSVSVTTTQWNDEHGANKRTAPADFSKRTFAFECLGLLNYGFDKLPAHELCVVLMCGPPETTSRPHTPTYVSRMNSMVVFIVVVCGELTRRAEPVTWLCAPCRRVLTLHDVCSSLNVSGGEDLSLQGHLSVQCQERQPLQTVVQQQRALLVQQQAQQSGGAALQ